MAVLIKTHRPGPNRDQAQPSQASSNRAGRTITTECDVEVIHSRGVGSNTVGRRSSLDLAGAKTQRILIVHGSRPELRTAKTLKMRPVRRSSTSYGLRSALYGGTLVRSSIISSGFLHLRLVLNATGRGAGHPARLDIRPMNNSGLLAGNPSVPG